METLSQDGQALLFTEARTYSAWQDTPVPDVLLRELYDLMKFGPTSANCCPLRIVFVTSPEAKERLKPCLAEGNIDKTMSAPVCAILGMDAEFYELMPKLFPHTDAKSWFVGNKQLIADTVFRNSSLQAAYFIMAARALGLDCGPMSGFDEGAVNSTFFAGTTFKANMLCNLGYGDPVSLHPRSPRLTFDDACQVQ